MAVFVRAHRRGKSSVRAYQRSYRVSRKAMNVGSATFNRANNVRYRAAKILRKKIAIGNILLKRESDPSAVLSRMYYRGTK